MSVQKGKNDKISIEEIPDFLPEVIEPMINGRHDLNGKSSLGLPVAQGRLLVINVTHFAHHVFSIKKVHHDHHQGVHHQSIKRVQSSCFKVSLRNSCTCIGRTRQGFCCSSNHQSSRALTFKRKAHSKQ
jgi:hypothetical protein